MITNSEDCYSTLSDIARNDFEQLFSFVRDIQDFMVSQLPTDQRERVTLLEIQLNFLEPLKNLAQLNQSLFEATKSRLNKDQTTLLIGWQYMIAIFLLLYLEVYPTRNQSSGKR